MWQPNDREEVRRLEQQKVREGLARQLEDKRRRANEGTQEKVLDRLASEEAIRQEQYRQQAVIQQARQQKDLLLAEYQRSIHQRSL